MKIAVCVKQVPDATVHKRIDPTTKRLDRSGEGALNATDLNAVEEALRIKEAQGGEVVLVSLGPAKSLDSLRKALAMGADFDRHSYLPITLHGGGLQGIRYRSPRPSAQVKSAILLAGIRTTEPVEVLEPIPSRDHTEQMLRQFGCDVEVVEGRYGRLVRLGPDRKLRGRKVRISGDPSSAAFPIVAALITPHSKVTVRGVLDSATRSGLLTTLAEMGADIRFANRREVGGSAVMDVTARSSALRGVKVPKKRAPSMIDEYPILAIAAAFAAGETVMEGLGELRVKESDRIAAIEAGLSLCGIEARCAGDSLSVTGCNGAPRGRAVVQTERDHRIAMAFLILGLGAKEPVAVDDAAMISTSFPDFAGLMQSLGAEIAPF
jgi:3-phosphoshikimate 1-carboxyvinyltransferase